MKLYKNKKKYTKTLFGKNKALYSSIMIAAVVIGLLTDTLKEQNFQETMAPTVVQSENADVLHDEQVTDGELTIHYLDVGHGDATLLTCDGMSMLIDCGDGTQGTKIQNYLQKRGIEKLDYLILTHPDKDHIGGAPVIITKFDIDTMFMSYYEKDNSTYDRLMETIEYKRQIWSTPEVGDSYQFGSAYFTVLAPNDIYEDSNDASIAIKLTHEDNDFLFTGDAEKKAEKDMVASGYDLSADVLHVGHHGSNSSTKKSFLEAVMPTYAVISCDYNGDYGHPRAEVLNRLRENGVKVFRTDEQGTIVATSDGKTITFNMSPSETWQAGEPKGN